MKKLHRAEGFTLIELMIVILIIAILVAIAVPIYINATNNAKKRTCQANLRTIDGSEATWKADNTDEGESMGSIPISSLVTLGYLKSPGPSCPGNKATYVLNAGYASCTYGNGHSYP